MFDEKLEEMKNSVYENDDKKKIIKLIIICAVVLIIVLIGLFIKSKIDYSNNVKNLEKYATEYYNENMKSANPAAGYVVSLQMLEGVDKYDLKYFKKCDKTETAVDIYVDEIGEIIKKEAHLKCK